MTLVWDWNGTLLDDTDASIAALNDVLIDRNIKPITKEFYKEVFSFPVKAFYDRCGLNASVENWDKLARDYHDAYFSHTVDIFPDTKEALSLARDIGYNQVLLSNLRQDYLDKAVDCFQLRDFFSAVRGSDNMNGGSKIESARRFLSDISISPKEAIFIGDAIHDKEVADAVGSRAILFSGGTHSHNRLATLAPSFSSLIALVKSLV